MKMKNINWQQQIFYTSLTLCITSFGLAAFGVLSYQQIQKDKIQGAREKTKRQAILATLEIERELRSYQKPALSLASWLSSQENLSDEEVLQQTQTLIKQEPKLKSLGIAYRVFLHPSKNKLYSPTYVRDNNELKQIQLEDYYDYTKPQYPWFRNTIIEGRRWGEPYYWPKSNLLDQPIFGFYSPFYQQESGKQIPQGVVHAEYSFDHLKEIMESLSLGKTGYGFLMSKKGTFITHPNQKYVRNRQKIIDIFQDEENEEELINKINRSLEGEIIATEFIDNNSGKKSWLYLRPIQFNDWIVGVVFFEQEVLLDSVSKRRRLIWISLGVNAGLLCLLSLGLRVEKGNQLKLWLFAIAASLVFITEIGYVWSLALASRNYFTNRILLLNQAELEKILTRQTRRIEQFNQVTPLSVPTGLLLHSLKFSSSDEVFITAYIWQKYTQGIHDDISQGFILPDAVDANDLEITEKYRHLDENVEVVGWYVEATLRQGFDFTKYPLDQKDIEIQVWHQDFDKLVILTPDFEGYQLLNPSLKPGVDSGLFLDGWEVNSSFFEYKFKETNANYGLTNNFKKDIHFPEFYFTVTLTRDFIDPLISKLVALICVVSLLFAMLTILDEDKALEVLGVSAGLIFILIVDQISVRESIAAEGLIYFDYFYFVIYVYIFFVSVNALCFLNEKSLPKFIKYKNNLPAKLAYWPSLLMTLLLLTISVFY